MSKAKKVTSVVSMLQATKRLLQRVGWVKYVSVKRDKNGKTIGYCLSGAMNHVNASFPARRGAFNRIYAQLEKQFPLYDPNTYIEGFNDAPRRTKQQVIDLINSAIKSKR